jgi:site-specific recombinase XerD
MNWWKGRCNHMTQTRQHMGQLVGSRGLRRMAGPPGSSFEMIVVDRQGRPVSHLSEWYRRRHEPGPDRTRQTYLGMLFPVMGFFLERGYVWNDSPEQVRTYLVEFLRERLTCRMQPDQDREGYWIEPSKTSPLSKSGLGVLLAAIKDFYRVMRDAGYYVYPSPMTSHLLEQWRRERARLIGSSGAPDHAGIRSESWEESRRHPVAYFRQGKRKQWQPKIALESAEVRERMWEALVSMTTHAPTQRDKVVLLLLRHTGARLHEILGMTVGGYRKAAGPLNALVVNKGSLGREEKLITFLDTDEEELLKYIRGERAQYDSLGRTQLVDLDDSDPLFLTARRKPYADAAFRYHWHQLMQQAKKRFQVSFTPHAVRHLFVTQHLVWIKQEAGDDREEQQRLKAGLVHIMGWHSRETLRIYDHSFSLQEAVHTLHAFQRKAESQAQMAVKAAGLLVLPSSLQEEITFIEAVEPPSAFAQLWEELV